MSDQGVAPNRGGADPVARVAYVSAMLRRGRSKPQSGACAGDQLAGEFAQMLRQMASLQATLTDNRAAGEAVRLVEHLAVTLATQMGTTLGVFRRDVRKALFWLLLLNALQVGLSWQSHIGIFTSRGPGLDPRGPQPDSLSSQTDDVNKTRREP